MTPTESINLLQILTEMKRVLLTLSSLLIMLGSFAQTMTELSVPQYFAGRTGTSTNNGRIYVMACVSIDGLTPNTSYDLRAGLARVNEASTAFGAGNYWNGINFGTSVWQNAFTTDANGSSGPVWVALQPTANNTSGRFAPDTLHQIRLGVAPNGSSISSNPMFATTNSIRAIEVGPNPITSSTTDDGAFIKGNANAGAEGLYVLAYDNVAGAGNPISINRIRNHDYNQFGQNELPADIDSILKPGSNVAVGDYAILIPATSTNGVRRLETRDANFNLIAFNTSATGVWNGQSTDNLNRRDIVNLTQNEAPLVPSSPTITLGTTGFNNVFGPTGINIPVNSTFSVSGTNLNGPVDLMVNPPFSMRLAGSGAGFTNNLQLPDNAGTLAATDVEVRFSAGADGNYPDSIMITSPGATMVKLGVTGIVQSTPEVEFVNTSTIFTEEGQTVNIAIKVNNLGNNTVQVSLAPRTVGVTAFLGQQFSVRNNNVLIFDNTTGDQQNFVVDLIDDNNSGPRTRNVRFGLNITGGTVNSAKDSVSMAIIENDYEFRKIAQVKRLDANFETISTDSLFEVAGIVIGGNTRASGYSFTIMDETGGISNFAPASASTFGYIITEGDSITMRGRVGQFNGLAQLDFLDTIILHKQGATLPAPIISNGLSEVNENVLTRINKVRLVTPVPNWLVSGSGANFRAYNTVTNDTFEIRVVNVNPLANTPAPQGEFDIIGIGGQFDNSRPFNSGYQLFPRYAKDIIQDSIGNFNLLTPANNATLNLSGDPSQTVTPTWEAATVLLGSNTLNYVFHVDVPTGSFNPPLLSFPSNNAGSATEITLPYGVLADTLAGILTPGNQITIKWTVTAQAGTEVQFANDAYLLTIVRDAITGIAKAYQVGKVYPNPASQKLHLDLEVEPSQVSIIALNGMMVKEISEISKNMIINTSDLTNGVYLLNFVVDGKPIQHKFVIHNR